MDSAKVAFRRTEVAETNPPEIVDVRNVDADIPLGPKLVEFGSREGNVEEAEAGVLEFENGKG